MSSELGDTFKAWKEHNKKKKASNFERSLGILKTQGVSFKQLSETHLRVGSFDYWPSTGLFIEQKTGKRGRGIFRLLKELGVPK